MPVFTEQAPRRIRRRERGTSSAVEENEGDDVYATALPPSRSVSRLSVLPHFEGGAGGLPPAVEGEDDDAITVASSTTAKKVGEEFSPQKDSQKIGIELEGIGTVSVKWNKSGYDKHQNFHDVFKRTPLVRSGSFGEGRGVYIVPEDVDEGYGERGPAELVSNPHNLNKQGLGYLLSSYKKAMSGNSATNAMLKPQEAQLKDPTQSEEGVFNRSQYTATTRWNRRVLGAVAGSLQTTIGVEVRKLLSDDKQTRIKIVEKLIGDSSKRQATRDLLLAAICVEKVLTRRDNPLEAYKDKADGIRLAIFMYLLNAFQVEARDFAKSPQTWAKVTYGANFKGDSSFDGCGVVGAKEALAEWLSENPELKNVLIKDIVDEMNRQGLAPWVVGKMQGVKRVFSLEAVGGPGLSMQTAVEGWFSIPNFFSNGRLYTVVESREKESGLNKNMASFLNGKIGVENLIQEFERNGLLSAPGKHV
ncbi:hypothetical protein [Burkholderia ubonensis]|uniref:hypothetical protein n=1 Tax=Burkholderia ubonensis TaxID=101571 RepID=UPI000A63922D|nr:hypothetical protein [Burkholderia ubonensis]